MTEDLRSRLAAIVGVSGVGADSVVRPSNVTQLREVFAACAAAGASVAADRDGARADVVVSVGRLDVVRLDAPALLLRAGAASTWSAIREAAAARRLAVVALGTPRSDRVGPSVALGEVPRRALAGVDLVTPSGLLISAAGRTLKDVVGYDLCGLVLGSGDRLGLVAAVTLRLEPAAARTPAEAGPGPWRGDAGIDLIAAFSA